uniref:Acetyl-coenzyme A carboxylase carboxyl transferase subunit beta n=2 Tax=Abrus TaxID=3815 RepID=A0A6H0ENM9_ABRPR|nr:acetyl-CoA carboxylase carboxyltransferase beta subunit [Abrus precatorius]QIT03129.1 acetyl-CoA carboxylase carboxyltransferase beta subunit [Abrus precatorius]QJW34003.1 acetyl-CoA carboxylase carboxyltransferase beta subunit [Abrus pulchellus subsp. cantoniensis]
MEKWWFTMLFNRELEYRCGLSKSIDSFGPIENTCVNEDLPILADMDKKTHSWNDSDNSSYSFFQNLVGIRNIQNFLSDKTFLVRDSKRKSYSIYFDIEKKILEIDNDHSFLSESESFFSSYNNSSYLKNVSKSDDDHYMYDTKFSWNNNINSCINSYLRSQICIDSSILGDSDKYNDSYFYSYICGKGRNTIENKNYSSSLITSTNHTNNSDSTQRESSDNLAEIQKYKHLWIECENCYGLNYKKYLKSKINICEHCGYHLKMSSSDRIELSIDPGTWNPMDEDMVSLDPIEFHSEEEPYKDRIDSYQRKTGLTEAVQTGTGQLNGIPVAIGIMDFKFMGGSMGSVVGEKITRLVEYATNQLLPLILVCASGGARMQEGSLSLMQMAKISSVLYNYQTNKKLFYVSILTSPTTGGVTASFGMLGDIIIAEPNTYIAFAGKRVIEQTLNKAVPEGSQAAEYLFHKGLFDSIVPRNPLKGVLGELFQLHAFFSLTQNEK